MFEGEGGIGLLKSFEKKHSEILLKISGGRGRGWSDGQFLKIFLSKREGLICRKLSKI